MKFERKTVAIASIGVAPSQIRRLALGAFFVAVAACTGGDAGSPRSSNSSAGATVTSSASTSFPIDLPLTPEIEAASAAASLQSATLDRACDAMVFTEAEQSRRVSGKGCPRQGATEEGAK